MKILKINWKRWKHLGARTPRRRKMMKRSYKVWSINFTFSFLCIFNVYNDKKLKPWFLKYFELGKMAQLSVKTTVRKDHSIRTSLTIFQNFISNCSLCFISRWVILNLKKCVSIFQSSHQIYFEFNKASQPCWAPAVPPCLVWEKNLISYKIENPKWSKFQTSGGVSQMTLINDACPSLTWKSQFHELSIFHKIHKYMKLKIPLLLLLKVHS